MQEILILAKFPKENLRFAKDYGTSIGMYVSFENTKDGIYQCMRRRLR